MTWHEQSSAGESGGNSGCSAYWVFTPASITRLWRRYFRSGQVRLVEPWNTLRRYPLKIAKLDMRNGDKEKLSGEAASARTRESASYWQSIERRRGPSLGFHGPHRSCP